MQRIKPLVEHVRKDLEYPEYLEYFEDLHNETAGRREEQASAK
jgi:hypothetical protein